MSTSDRPDAGVTSLSLLERAKGRDATAWGRLVQLYSPLIAFWARRSHLPDEDAADVVQEVWTSVSGALDRFHRDETTGTFRGWLWTITRNKLRDHARKHSGSAEAAGGTAAQAVLLSVPEDEPDDATGVESNGLLRRALDLIRSDFEDRTWRAFWEMTVGGRSAAEVGAELGLAANAVHQAKFRVLHRLRQELAGLGLADAESFTPSA